MVVWCPNLLEPGARRSTCQNQLTARKWQPSSKELEAREPTKKCLERSKSKSFNTWATYDPVLNLRTYIPTSRPTMINRIGSHDSRCFMYHWPIKTIHLNKNFFLSSRYSTRVGLWEHFNLQPMKGEKPEKKSRTVESDFWWDASRHWLCDCAVYVYR